MIQEEWFTLNDLFSILHMNHSYSTVVQRDQIIPNGTTPAASKQGLNNTAI